MASLGPTKAAATRTTTPNRSSNRANIQATAITSASDAAGVETSEATRTRLVAIVANEVIAKSAVIVQNAGPGCPVFTIPAGIELDGDGYLPPKIRRNRDLLGGGESFFFRTTRTVWLFLPVAMNRLVAGT